MASKERDDLAAALLKISEGLSATAKNPGMDGYRPHAKQLLFHQSEDYVRLYIGGNRAGKTHGGVMEDLWWATGTHPYIKTPPPPVRIRVIVVDFIQGLGQIMMPKFKALVRKQDLKGGSWDRAWNKSDRELTFKNGSVIQFLSYEQDLEKFAGTSQNLIHFDEEPPPHIYTECAARLIDTGGRIIITMTPVEGITWVHDDIYEKTETAADVEVLVERTPDIGGCFHSDHEETTVIEVGMNENPFLGEKEQARFLKTVTSEEEKTARSKGTFMSVGGKVFKEFDRKSHTIPVIPNPGEFFQYCYIYTSTDHGWNNPTAWLWHAVFPDGRIVTFHEHYQSYMTVKDHAKIVHDFEKKYKIQVDVRTGDPAMGQHNAVTGTSYLQEYAKEDLPIYTDSVPKDPSIGIMKMTQYFKPLGEVKDEYGYITQPGTPMWVITEDCVNFIKELSNLQWQKYESRKMQFKHNKQENVQKKDDHAFDSAKYFATFLPDLAPDVPVPAKVNVNRYNDLVRYDEALLRAEERKQEQDASGWSTLEVFS